MGVLAVEANWSSYQKTDEVRLTVDGAIRYCVYGLHRTIIGGTGIFNGSGWDTYYFQFPSPPGETRVDFFQYSTSLTSSMDVYGVWNVLMPDDAHYDGHDYLDDHELVESEYDAGCLNRYPHAPAELGQSLTGRGS